MTNEEAIMILKAMIDEMILVFDRDRKKALNMAIEALKAQPESCEDAVSRRRLLSDLKELIAAWEKYPVMAEQIKGVKTAIGYVKSIPSVTPKRKKGKWIIKKDEKTDMTYGECSSCSMKNYAGRTNFCPNCGADMRGEQDEL